jgi:hypothetical protein
MLPLADICKEWLADLDAYVIVIEERAAIEA